MSVLLPIILAASGIVMLASSAGASEDKSKKVKDKASKAALDAAKNGEFERAAALALESGNEKAVKSVTDTLKKNGLAEAAREVERKAKDQAERRAKAKKEAAKKAKEKDYSAAIAQALASRDQKTVKDVMKTLEKAGKSKEAAALWSSFSKLVAELSKKAEKPKAKPEPAVKVTVKKPVSAAVKDAVPKPKPKPTPSPAVKVEVKEKPKAASKPDPKKEQAGRLIDALKKGKRYTDSEPKDAVADYQKANKLTPVDGMYGRGTAMSLWTLYRMLPPNPYYWPKSNTNAALAEYKRFLDGIVQQSPAKKNAVEELKKTVGR